MVFGYYHVINRLREDPGQYLECNNTLFVCKFDSVLVTPPSVCVSLDVFPTRSVSLVVHVFGPLALSFLKTDESLVFLETHRRPLVHSCPSPYVVPNPDHLLPFLLPNIKFFLLLGPLPKFVPSPY